LAGVFYFLKKTAREFVRISYFLNIFTLILFLLPIINLLNYKLNISKISENLRFKKTHIGVPISKNKKRPNIYYIVLDAYAREDILKEFYGFDNSDFIQFLRENGFYIGNKSRSIYPATVSSLSSTFNMDFVATNSAKMEAKKNAVWPLYEDLENNTVVEFLKAQGYKYIHFTSDARVTDSNKNADLVMTSPYWLPTFTSAFAERTFLKTLNLDILNPIKIRQKTILYAFDKLRDISKESGPTFTFAHFMMPHWPMVFDRNGNTPKGPKGEGINGYLEFIRFANKKVKNLIQDLISQSDSQPIIILQSDHGFEHFGTCMEPSELVLKEKMAILNAYFVPDEIKEGLYESITPVNTFKVIFNRYFGTKLKLLEDKVFFTYCYSSTYQPVRVPDEKYLPTGPENLGSNKEWIESLEDTIIRFPGNVCVSNTLGVEYFKNHDYQKAAKHLELALKVRNDNIAYLIYRNLGIVFRAQQKAMEAVEAFKKSLDLEPNRAETNYLLAEAYIVDGKYRQAEPLLDELNLIYPKWEKLSRLRAKVYFETGNHEKAIKEYRNVLSFKFQDADIHLKIGSSYDEIKDGRKAIFHTIIGGQLFAITNKINKAKNVEKNLEILLSKYKFQSSDFSHVRVDQIPSKGFD
jgi:tetratricopeptide (TPR) repeat protein